MSGIVNLKPSHSRSIWDNVFGHNKVVVSMSMEAGDQEIMLNYANEEFLRNFHFTTDDDYVVDYLWQPNSEDILRDTQLRDLTFGEPVLNEIMPKNKEDVAALPFNEDIQGFAPTHQRVVHLVGEAMVTGSRRHCYALMRRRDGDPLFCHLQITPLTKSPSGDDAHIVKESDDEVNASERNTDQMNTATNTVIKDEQTLTSTSISTSLSSVSSALPKSSEGKRSMKRRNCANKNGIKKVPRVYSEGALASFKKSLQDKIENHEEVSSQKQVHASDSHSLKSMLKRATVDDDSHVHRDVKIIPSKHKRLWAILTFRSASSIGSSTVGGFHYFNHFATTYTSSKFRLLFNSDPTELDLEPLSRNPA